MEESNDTEHHGLNQSTVKRKRRIHNSESSKRKINKEKRLAGVEYVGFSTTNDKMKQDKPKKAREMGPSCSSKYCDKSKVRHCNKFDDSTRSKIFKSFWNLPHWSAKQLLVQGLVKSVNVNMSRTKESRRKQTYKFFLYLNGTPHQVLHLLEEFSKCQTKI